MEEDKIRDYNEYGFDPEYGPYVVRPTVPAEPDFSKADRYSMREDPFKVQRKSLIEAIRNADQGYIGKVLVAKAIEELLDAKVSEAVKQCRESLK